MILSHVLAQLADGESRKFQQSQSGYPKTLHFRHHSSIMYSRHANYTYLRQSQLENQRAQAAAGVRGVRLALSGVERGGVQLRVVV